MPLEADEIEKFFHQRGTLSWETRPVRIASFDDLNTDLIEEFARRRPSRKMQTGKAFEVGRFLEQLGCAASLVETTQVAPLYPTCRTAIVWLLAPGFSYSVGSDLCLNSQ